METSIPEERRRVESTFVRVTMRADLYGVQPAPAGRPVSTRVVVWSVTTLVCVLFFGFALTQRESAPPPVPVPQAPTVLYGVALPAGSAFGHDAVCTEYEVDGVGGWRCDTAVVNSAHVPVYTPTHLSSRCPHVTVVGHDWTCVAPTTAPAA